MNDGWLTSLFDVWKTVVEFFTNHVEANTWERPKLDEVPFDRFSNEENDALIAPFSMLEIKVVVRDSDRNKSSEPDGFNFSFVEFWYLLRMR